MYLEPKNLAENLQAERTPYRQLNKWIVVKKRHFEDGLKGFLSLKELKKKLRRINPRIVFKAGPTAFEGVYYPRTEEDPLTHERYTALTCQFSIASNRVFTSVPYEEFYALDHRLGEAYTPTDRDWETNP